MPCRIFGLIFVGDGIDLTLRMPFTFCEVGIRSDVTTFIGYVLDTILFD